METISVSVDEIYVPVKLRGSLDETRVESVAESYIENGRMTPIRVRRDGERLVLVHGIHRLEACRALGEETITVFVVQAAKH
jgi:ParB-like chromosome segregation protein Spo0J